MHDDRPSRTAERVAIRRAAHQLLDHPRVFDDPLALAILEPEQRAALERDAAAVEDSPIAPYLRMFLAVRSRFAEDGLRAAIARGVRQYLVLGGGLDTSCYRWGASHAELRCFEVDHPATQAWKRTRLAEGGIAVPSNMRLVTCDFERERVPAVLASAGFDASAPAYCAWLGVTMYLTSEALDETLAMVAAWPPGSAVAFDYALPAELLDARQRAVLQVMADQVRSAGEPWQTFLDPGELAAQLASLGIAQLEDLDATAMHARYLAGRADGARVGGLAHLMLARR